jgi:hypothetical protein
MSNPIEVAHQAIKAGAGYVSAASSAGMTTARLIEILLGRSKCTSREAARIGAATGQCTAQLAVADPDFQLLANRNATI